MARSAILIFVIAWPERCQDGAKRNPDIRNRSGKMLADEMNFLEAKRHPELAIAWSQSFGCNRSHDGAKCNPDIRNRNGKMLVDEMNFLEAKRNPDIRDLLAGALSGWREVQS